VLGKLSDQIFNGFVRVIIIIMFRTRRWNVDFLDKFYAWSRIRRGTWMWWFFWEGDGRIRRGKEGAEGRGRRVREYSLTWNEGNGVVRQRVWGSVETTAVELQAVEEEEEGEKLFRLHYYRYYYCYYLVMLGVAEIEILRVGLVQETTRDPVPSMPETLGCPSAVGRVGRRSLTIDKRGYWNVFFLLRKRVMVELLLDVQPGEVEWVNQKEERTTMLVILLELKANKRMGEPRY